MLKILSAIFIISLSLWQFYRIYQNTKRPVGKQFQMVWRVAQIGNLVLAILLLILGGRILFIT